jgi:hypothetical protein
MSEFYLSDSKDLVRCQGSMTEQKRVAVVGRIGNEVKKFKGIVQDISEDRTGNPKRWRIKMLDD